nr:alpha/beta fold hydrolase [Coleofasciculus sp. FACHB-SPT36]
MACSADLWDEQLAYAARTRRAIAIDLRGHGASSPPEDDDYSPASCAADLLAVLEALGLEHIALVGHSFGACVALAAAAAKLDLSISRSLGTASELASHSLRRRLNLTRSRSWYW